MLKVELFGVGQASYLDRRLPGFPNQQACQLFCFLLLNKQGPHSRDRIAALFWGDYDSSTSRKYFRNALWRLRQTLQAAGAPPDDYLLANDESVAFINLSDYWLDLEAFENIVKRFVDTPGEELSADQAKQLEMAIDYYSGDLLESIYADWCLYDRERLRLMYLHSLQKLILYYRSQGNFERGLYHGKRLLTYDPTRESTHREIMRLYWLLGDRNAAMAQYQICRQILREEVGIRPMEDTRQLYEQIIHSQAQPEKANQHAPTAPPAEKLDKVADHAMDRLVQLQNTLEKANLELAQLEQLISRALAEV